MVAMPDTNIDLDLSFDAQKSEFKNFSIPNTSYLFELFR